MRERRTEWPDVVATIPGARRRVPASDSVDPARAAWIDRLVADPAGARRELAAARADYWRRRVAMLEAETADAERRLEQAARRDEETGVPAAGPETLASLEEERAEALAAVFEARRKLRECERAAMLKRMLDCKHAAEHGGCGAGGGIAQRKARRRARIGRYCGAAAPKVVG